MNSDWLTKWNPNEMKSVSWSLNERISEIKTFNKSFDLWRMSDQLKTEEERMRNWAINFKISGLLIVGCANSIPHLLKLISPISELKLWIRKSEGSQDNSLMNGNEINEMELVY